MGTVLSFSPRERRPIYTTHHHGSGTISTSSSTEFTINNYSYEQMNNVKNRENTKPINLQTVPNITNNNGSSNNLAMFGSTNHHANIININNNTNNNTINITTNNGSTIQERHADSARILSEKNALEKNLKKHSLFINALSWKRLAASHGKKKLDNNKNKTANISTSTFRPPGLTDTVHPMVVVADKNKNKQQIQLSSSNSNINNANQQLTQSQAPPQQPTVYFTPGGPKTLLALDLVRAANNANTLQQQHVDKLGPKLPIQLPLPANVQQKQHHSHHGPRKTVIQVSF